MSDNVRLLIESGPNFRGLLIRKSAIDEFEPLPTAAEFLLVTVEPVARLLFALNPSLQARSEQTSVLYGPTVAEVPPR